MRPVALGMQPAASHPLLLEKPLRESLHRKPAGKILSLLPGSRSFVDVDRLSAGKSVIQPFCGSIWTPAWPPSIMC